MLPTYLGSIRAVLILQHWLAAFWLMSCVKSPGFQPTTDSTGHVTERFSNCQLCTRLPPPHEYTCIIVPHSNSAEDFLVTCGESLLCTIDSYFQRQTEEEECQFPKLNLGSSSCTSYHNPFYKYEEINNIKLPIIPKVSIISFDSPDSATASDRKSKVDEFQIICTLNQTTYLKLAYSFESRLRNFNFLSLCSPRYYHHNVTRVVSKGISNSELQNGAFSQLPNLKHLQLIDAELRQIEEQVFVPVAQMNWLDLTKNNLTTLPNSVFESLTQLRVLNFSDNYLDNGIFQILRPLTSLEVLILEKNEISLICSQCFEKLQCLRVLNLAWNRFETLGPLQYMNNLRELSLRFNSLMDISNNVFKDNMSLNHLDISDNSLETFPKLSSLFSLQHLDLRNNLIGHVSSKDSDMLCNLTNLKYLFFEITLSHKVNTDFLNCPNSLTEVHIKYSRISDITIFRKSNIQFLNLERNHVAHFSFKDVSSAIIKLDVSYNKIKTWIKDGPQIGEKQIQKLILKGNQLQDLSDLKLPATLQYLDLSNNELISFSIANLQELVDLNTVNLEKNKLNYVCHLLFPGHQVQANFQLHLNPIICSCELQQLQKVDNTFTTFQERQTICPKKNGPMTSIHFSTEYSNRNESKSSDEISFDDKINADRAKTIGNMKKLLEDRFSCKTKSEGTCQCNVNSSYVSRCGLQCPTTCSCFISADYDFHLVNCTYRNLALVPAWNNLLKLPLSTFLSGNVLEFINATTLSSYTKAKQMYFNNNHLKLIDENTFAYFISLEVLDLSLNMLTVLFKKLFSPLKYLKALYLNHNRLKSLSISMFQPLKNINILHLDNNLLTNFPVWLLEEMRSIQLEGITVNDNPWLCNCKYFNEFRNWIRVSHLVKNAEQVYCLMQSNDSKSEYFLSAETKHCHEVLIINNITMWSVIVSFTVLIFLMVNLAYWYRREIQVLVYSLCGIRLLQGSHLKDTGKIYDVFIAYSSDDEQFVAEELIPGMENITNPYRVCVHHRDFLVGALITESILEAVDKSCRTIVVLSQSFVNSGWCRFEFKTAHNMSLCDRVARLIVIIKGRIPDGCDPEMRHYLKTNTYLQWGDTLFWKKLYFALPDRGERHCNEQAFRESNYIRDTGILEANQLRSLGQNQLTSEC